MREILVAVDASEASRRASRFVNRFFGDLDVAITAVNVGKAPLAWGPEPLSPGLAYPWPAAGSLWPPVATPTVPTTADAAAVDASTVDDAERVLESSGLHADDRVVEAGGDVAETLCRIADERDVDVIVVGSRQKAFLERLISPSVSTDLAKAAPRPVLIVH